MSEERSRPRHNPTPLVGYRPNWAGQFDTFNDWVNHARWRTAMTPFRKALIARIIELWNAGGRSASDIARELGIESRNSVIGALFRARVKGVHVVAKTPKPRKVVAKKERRIAIKPKKAAPLPAIKLHPEVACKPLHLSIIDLKPRNCRFIFDEATYCGLTATRKSYCPEHAALVYQLRGEPNDAPGR